MADLERPELAVLTAYLEDLRRELRGPRRAKADLLAEARGSLIDATSAYEARGLTIQAAQQAAVADFGVVARIAPEYQAELAVAQSRRTGLLILGVFLAQCFLWDDASASARSTQHAWLIATVKWSGGLVMLLAVLALFAARRAGRWIGLVTGMFGYAVAGVFTMLAAVLTSLRLGTEMLGLSGVPRTVVFLLLPLMSIVISARRSLRAASA
jgi:hypothetical protein